MATELGIEVDAPGLVSWDEFDAVVSPDEVMLLMKWRDGNRDDRDEGSGSAP
jgi:hypothetical protein